MATSVPLGVSAAGAAGGSDFGGESSLAGGASGLALTSFGYFSGLAASLASDGESPSSSSGALDFFLREVKDSFFCFLAALSACLSWRSFSNVSAYSRAFYASFNSVAKTSARPLISCNFWFKPRETWLILEI